jgi:hypothetical protein
MSEYNFKTFDPPEPKWVIEGYSVRETILDGMSPMWIWVNGRRGSTKYEVRNPGVFDTEEAAVATLRSRLLAGETATLAQLVRIRAALSALPATNNTNDTNDTP